MSKLAIHGGNPVTNRFISQSNLKTRKNAEREYLLQAHDSGVWDDWPEKESMASGFGKEWAQFCGSEFCALLTNGTHTLQVALESLDIGAGDEVIVPGLTWQATASAVCDVNAVPLLADVNADTLCIDPGNIEALITPRTKAIIPVHLYHRQANMDEIMRIACDHNLYVIEDCAHSHGSQWDSKGVGTRGSFGSFSFQQSKLMTAGEGGSLLMQNEDMYWKVVSQRSCGREYRGYNVHSGNYRMTSFQAAVLRGQLLALKENAGLINERGLQLDSAVADAPGVSPLRRHENITRQCSYAFVFLYDEQSYDGLPCDRFRRALAAELGFDFHAIYTPLSHSEVYYPHTKKRHKLNEEYLKAIHPQRWNLPVADDIWQNRAVMATWHIFGCDAKQIPLLSDAITKIYENRKELLKG